MGFVWIFRPQQIQFNDDPRMTRKKTPFSNMYCLTAQKMILRARLMHTSLIPINTYVRASKTTDKMCGVWSCEALSVLVCV